MTETEVITCTLPVMESFYTIQGEGHHTGKPAWFIRLGGCDVGCFWCDVKDSWDPEGYPLKTPGQLILDVGSLPANIAVVTGGEPLLHELSELTNNLKESGFQTHLETSGAYKLSGDWDWICLSPKKFKPALPEVYHLAQELKVIVYNRSDLAWAENEASKVNRDCKLFLQPEWSKREEMMPLIVEYVKESPKWQISLQTHKYLNIP